MVCSQQDSSAAGFPSLAPQEPQALSSGLLPRVVPSQLQDLVLDFTELHKVCVGPFLQPGNGPVDGSPALHHVLPLASVPFHLPNA